MKPAVLLNALTFFGFGFLIIVIHHDYQQKIKTGVPILVEHLVYSCQMRN